MPIVSTCIIASNGTETDHDNPTPTWGTVAPSALEEGDLQFQAAVTYQEGDTVHAGAARLQRDGHLLHGPLTLTRATSATAHSSPEDHPIYHRGTATAAHTQDRTGHPEPTTSTYPAQARC